MVTTISTGAGAEPLNSTTRFVRKEKKRVQIQCPNVISVYNKSMGGVDRSDQNISLYRASIRGKKWYYPLILHCVDLAVSNAWILHRLANKGNATKQMDHLEFKLAIAEFLISKNASARKSPSASSLSRFDNVGHLVYFPDGKVGRCAQCQKNAGYQCLKCQRFLHPKCFISYHSK